jgi:hypothetical protein
MPMRRGSLSCIFSVITLIILIFKSASSLKLLVLPQRQAVRTVFHVYSSARNSSTVFLFLAFLGATPTLRLYFT